MSTQAHPGLTPHEYLKLEREAESKSEYLNGEILAMSGGTRRHNLIAANAVASLHSQLRKRDCEVYGSDMRVKVVASGLYAYPDVSALCREAAFEGHRQDVLLNPDLLVEVLSDSTEAYDRGEKSEHYRRIETLGEYLLISQNKRHLERFRRQPDGDWILAEFRLPGDVVQLTSIDCRLLLSEIYAKVRLDSEPS